MQNMSVSECVCMHAQVHIAVFGVGFAAK
jgi:hypothetical protein